MTRLQVTINPDVKSMSLICASMGNCRETKTEDLSVVLRAWSSSLLLWNRVCGCPCVVQESTSFFYLQVGIVLREHIASKKHIGRNNKLELKKPQIHMEISGELYLIQEKDNVFFYLFLNF